ncbi:DinB family protein [Fimbriimonas ginsengisoli]|nr:DinB family protein [Fimbriimonas ginsengisoli]
MMIDNASTDLRQVISAMISEACETYNSDLSHVPEDKLHAIPMGAARTPASFTAECIGFNRFVARALRNEPVYMPGTEEREAFVRSFDSLTKLQEGLTDSCGVVIEALAALEPEELAAEVRAPWGQPLPAYRLAYYAASHMNYHDGQINYIQSLYGDGEMHWA